MCTPGRTQALQHRGRVAPCSMPTTATVSSRAPETRRRARWARASRPRPRCAPRPARSLGRARRLRAARVPRPIRSAASTTSRQREAEERLCGGECDRGVIALVRTVQRQVEVGVGPLGVRRSISRPPTARRFAVQSNSSPRTQDSTAPPVSRPLKKISSNSGAVSPTTSRQPGFTIPAFSEAMSQAWGRGSPRGRSSRS